ncbi:hypothetical protein K438DRAFT_1856856 [Mycena galopus ATCC 62051]|nr:hypothetical protein K438DRAFT_1856856 [Mycena galopus ATCC 62051]
MWFGWRWLKLIHISIVHTFILGWNWLTPRASPARKTRRRARGERRSDSADGEGGGQRRPRTRQTRRIADRRYLHQTWA